MVFVDDTILINKSSIEQSMKCSEDKDIRVCRINAKHMIFNLAGLILIIIIEYYYKVCWCLGVICLSTWFYYTKNNDITCRVKNWWLK